MLLKPATQQQKYKIMMLSDHPLSVIGVGCQARYLSMGLINTGKYTFRCLGGAIKHENYEVVAPHPDMIIKPVDGFGTREMLRVFLATEKPDAVLLFTDPRFFIWVWEMEDEVHQVCPIVYNHLWDNYPWPDFNRVLYESTDLLNCINWPTYQMLKERFPEKTHYAPHALPTEIFHTIPDEDAAAVRDRILNGKKTEFLLTWVSRNARRKLPSDVIASWKLFLDDLESKYGHRNAKLLMHTDPYDQEGPNLIHVAGMLGVNDSVIFSTEKASFQDMNALYNASDACINISNAEGFGLGILESLYTGTPVIAIKTGGLTRQVVNPYDGFINGVALEPEVKSLVGSQLVPYIYEDYVSHRSVANGIMQMYEYGPEKRKEIGKRAKEYVLSEYSMNRLIETWDTTLENTILNWRANSKRWEMIKL
jgi:glycosyltransferase involved in cell wall biosynthesis